MQIKIVLIERSLPRLLVSMALKNLMKKKLPIIQGEISSKMFENAISALILLHFLP